MLKVEEAHFFRLVSILHDLMLCDTKNPAKKEDLQSQVVNLLTLMPIKSYEELLSNVADLGKPENPEHEYNEMNMEVIAVLCKFLEKRLQEVRLAQASSSPDIDIHSLSFTRKLHPVLLSDCWAYSASCTRLPSLARRRESFCDTAFCRHCERPICSSDPKWATCRVIAWSV